MSFFSLLLNNGDMKTIEEIHRENLQALVDEFGSVTAVAGMIVCSDSQYSQWLNGSINSGTGKPRGLKPSSARRIEKACAKPTGWLDREHPLTPKESVAAPPRMIYKWVSEEEARLVSDFRTSSPIGRETILNAAAVSEKIITPGAADNQN